MSRRLVAERLPEDILIGDVGLMRVKDRGLSSYPSLVEEELSASVTDICEASGEP